jgi:DNA-binding transcriptional LysR family regulator
MEMMQLQMLVAVAEEHTLQKAAVRVYRTPKRLVPQFGKLDEEIGTPLFDRSRGRDFRLTPAGGGARRLCPATAFPKG